MELSYDEIRRIHRLEKNTSRLVEVEPDFYNQLRAFVKQEKEALGGDEVRGPYLMVGSLEEVTTNGNWPPFYDKSTRSINGE